MVTFNLDDRPKRIHAVNSQTRDEELLLYRDKRGPGVILNRPARVIWDLCDGSTATSAAPG